jgi:Mg2+/citrate symporter
VILAVIASTLGATTNGLISVSRVVTIVGLAGCITVAVAMTLRARDSIRAAERSSELLDRALAESERAQDELRIANEKLQRTNVSLRTLQVAVAQGFNLIDERTQGRLRELVEEAGDDLAALVAETLDD